MLGSGGFAKVFLMEEQETKKRQNIWGETTDPPPCTADVGEKIYDKQMAKEQHHSNHSIVKLPTSWIMDEIGENVRKLTFEKMSFLLVAGGYNLSRKWWNTQCIFSSNTSTSKTFSCFLYVFCIGWLNGSSIQSKRSNLNWKSWLIFLAACRTTCIIRQAHPLHQPSRYALKCISKAPGKCNSIFWVWAGYSSIFFISVLEIHPPSDIRFWADSRRQVGPSFGGPTNRPQFAKIVKHEGSVCKGILWNHCQMIQVKIYGASPPSNYNGDL